MNTSVERFILAAIPGGIIWGWLSMVVNSVSGAFAFEGSFVHDLTTFATGGAIFGVLVAGFLSLMGDKLPFKSRLLRAVFVSTSLWILLRIGGALLSHMDNERYHIVTSQTIQGFFMAIILGCILYPLWKKESVDQAM
jgi:sugar phosphate permease